MAKNNSAKPTPSGPEHELKLLNDFLKHSSKAWASKGVSIIRTMPLVRVNDSSMAPELSIYKLVDTEVCVGVAPVLSGIKGKTFVDVYPPIRNFFCLHNGYAYKIPRSRFKESYLRKKCQWFPSDLATPDVNAYAIEVGLHGDAFTVGLIRDARKAIEDAQMDLAAIGIAESLDMPAADAVTYAKQAFLARTSSKCDGDESYAMDFSESE